MLECHETGLYTIYRGDCRELFGLVHADALITDPPYGAKYKNKSNNRKVYSHNKWTHYLRDDNFAPIHGDDTPFDPVPLLTLAPKILLWGGNYFASRLPDSRCWLVWDKREGGKPRDQADCELAWTNVDAVARLYSHLWMGLCRRGEENLSKGGRKLHPAQKPVALMDWTLTTLGIKPGEVVFDPYMGSGSLGVACIRRGIRYIGVEIVQGYYEVARARLDKELADLASRPSQETLPGLGTQSEPVQSAMPLDSPASVDASGGNVESLTQQIRKGANQLRRGARQLGAAVGKPSVTARAKRIRKVAQTRSQGAAVDAETPA